MATTHSTGIRIATEDGGDTRSLLLLGTYVALLLTTVAAATAVALSLAEFTGSLAGFTVLAAGWLVVVCVAPVMARRGTAGIAARRADHAGMKPHHTIDAVVTTLLAR